MKSKIIVFAPHPDDETLGCGGTIAKKISEGYEVLIVILTDGRNALSELFGIYSEPTPHELREIRKEEVKKATTVLGVEEGNLVLLDFEDGILEKCEKEAQKEIIDILRENSNPSEVYLPYSNDDHKDHKATNKIVRRAIEKLGLNAITYEYSLVQKRGRVDPLLDGFLSFFKNNIVRVDISEFLPRKEAALKEFKSAISIISSRQKRPLIRRYRKFLRNEETFYIDK